MSGKSSIQWVLLGCIVLMLVLLEAIHLHVGWYNLFLALLISSAYVVILCVWILERGKRPLHNQGCGLSEHDHHRRGNP